MKIKVNCKKLTVALSLLLNFGLLFYYKYIDFTISTINNGMNLLGWESNIPTFDIILPVGISFFTFQAVGYTIDVYRNEIEAERRLDKMRKGFVANVSHELKTPISIISGYAEGLKLDIGDKTRREQYADVIIDESGRMNDMVLSLLELSRMESGQMPLDPQIYNLSEQLEETAARMIAKAGDVEISTEIPKDIYVCADMVNVDKILNNYLSNAISHLREGGKIVLSAESEGDEVRVSVYNDGEAIPPEEMERIWESFYRVDSSHKRESDRVGLGLSIVKAAVALHGTQCGVLNKPLGVEFWFTLKKENSTS